MRTLIFSILALLLTLSACNSKRSTTEADREAEYVEEGDTINPTEGEGEGTTGKKYMETATTTDSTAIEQ